MMADGRKGEEVRKRRPDTFMTEEETARAKRYSRIRLGLTLGSTAIGLAKAALFAYSGRSAELERALARRLPNRLVNPAYIALVNGASWLSDLPLGYLGGLQVERRFGLTNQSTEGWFTDHLKALALGTVLEVPLTTAAFAVIRRRPNDWWLVLASASVPLVVLGSQLAPVLIMPIFNKFTPIADRELATRIERLAASAGVTVADVYQMDMSRQTEKPNAFFTGLGRTKRIVLGDTLLDQFRPAEITGIVAHELGHQVHGDIWRLIGFASSLGFAGAYAMQRMTLALINRTKRRSGVDQVGEIASLPQMTLVLGLLGLVLMPLQNAFSRAIERRADHFAVALTGDGATYARAIARLAERSLSDPNPPAPVVFFLYSHPPVAERIAAARAQATIQRAAAVPE